MRPITLKMTAFGAYVSPTEINFAAGLGKSNFFLIHGATGSGKTTILDAICFALYGKTSGGSRTGEMMRSEQANPLDRTEVEFTFELRGKTYKIVRNPSYLRPKMRGGDGMTKINAAAQIFEDNRLIQTKNVSDYVENLLKFNHEQFRQVIMLPQGAFQRFLLADSKKKQEVLNTLFNAEFFKHVEDELKSRAASAKAKFENLTAQRRNLLGEIGENEDLKLLTEKLTSELEIFTSQIKILENVLNEAQKSLAEGENLAKQFRELDAKKKSLEAAKNLLGKLSAELNLAKIELERRKSEENSRKNLQKLIDELEKKKSSVENLRVKQNELQTAEKSLERAIFEVKRLEKLKKSCDETMTKITARISELSDAPARLSAAQAHERLLQEIESAKNEIFKAEKTAAAAVVNHEAAEEVLSKLRERQISGSASRLADKLEDGKPCPVCGSIHHPSPATSETIVPSDEQIIAAESKLKTLAEKKFDTAQKLAEFRSKLATLNNTLQETVPNSPVKTIAEAHVLTEKFSAELNELKNCKDRLENGKRITADTEIQLQEAQISEKKFSEAANKIRGEIAAMARDVDEKYSENPNLLDEEISAAKIELNRLKSAFERAQESFTRLNAQFAAQNATVDAENKNLDEISAKLEGKTTPPDIFALKKARDDAKSKWQADIDEKARISAKIEQLKAIKSKISAIDAELTTADRNFLMWKTISDVASGKISKISFQRYYLATMFSEIILEANNRLEKMSGGRYRFKKREEIADKRFAGGLDLEIVDDYSGTARPVETLSGGESFLASLSLALGLAAVVQNNSGGIKLDTIFIDEGFGTLDSETLDFALKTLLELQIGGRLVGIISHVEELKKEIPVRLEIKTSKTGSKAEFKHGLSRD